MEKANQRMQVLRHELSKLDQKKKDLADSDDDDDDDDLDDREGLQAELKELESQNAARQKKLDEYEKNKKWNVDNICSVKEDSTVVNPKAGQLSFTETGFLSPDITLTDEKDETKEAAAAQAAASSKSVTEPKPSATSSSTDTKPAAAKPASRSASAAPPAAQKPVKPTTSTVGPRKEPPVEVGVMETYPQFTDKYAHILEDFMAIPDLAGSKDFLLKYADILLQENASNYLLLASLEDEMNGHREKMKRTARQSQIITNIAELAKSLKTHPGNVIEPFFARLQVREHLEEFMAGCKAFQEKIIARAVVKKKEMDDARAARAAEEGPKDLSEIPREERLGPGGLDPLEVIETLPEDMVKAFESRNVDDLKAALMKLDAEEAEYHMKRCVDSGLWTVNT